MTEPLHRRVVVAEDDDDVRSLLARGLARRGWDVAAVSDGEEAVRSVLAAPTGVAVLDWNMPVMSGLEACSALTSDPRTAGVPVVLLTGRTTGSDAAAVRAAGASAHLPKPVSIDALDEVLNRLCPG